MIFDQGQQGQCKGYSFLAALKIMKPSIDHVKIIKELQNEPNLLTNQKAGRWFIEKGYLKDMKYIRTWQIPFVIKRLPIVSGLANAKWNTLPPYTIEWDQDGSHSIAIVSRQGGLYKIQNSWGDKWGDKGYCYLRAEDTKKLQSPCYLIL